MFINFQVQKNNYASFYDDQSQMWSICFDSSSPAIEFAKMVGSIALLVDTQGILYHKNYLSYFICLY